MPMEDKWLQGLDYVRQAAYVAASTVQPGLDGQVTKLRRAFNLASPTVQPRLDGEGSWLGLRSQSVEPPMPGSFRAQPANLGGRIKLFPEAVSGFWT